MKWFKARTKQEKVMIIVILLLVIGIITRWAWIKKEAGDAFKSRIERTETPPPDSLLNVRPVPAPGETDTGD